MKKDYHKLEIVLPIAGDGSTRNPTTRETFAFNQIYAVTPPNGSGGKGALVYTRAHPKPIQTAHDFSYKDWQTELAQIDPESGKQKYLHFFQPLGPKLMVNYGLISEKNLDRKRNLLCLPPIGKGGAEFKLDKEQFAELTKKVSEEDNYWLRVSHNLLSGLMTRAKKQQSSDNQIQENTETMMGCLGIITLLLLIIIGLLIAILCIVSH